MSRMTSWSRAFNDEGDILGFLRFLGFYAICSNQRCARASMRHGPCLNRQQVCALSGLLVVAAADKQGHMRTYTSIYVHEYVHGGLGYCVRMYTSFLGGVKALLILFTKK